MTSTISQFHINRKQRNFIHSFSEHRLRIYNYNFKRIADRDNTESPKCTLLSCQLHLTISKLAVVNLPVSVPSLSCSCECNRPPRSQQQCRVVCNPCPICHLPRHWSIDSVWVAKTSKIQPKLEQDSYREVSHLIIIYFSGYHN